jgi:hypothetical protein
MSTSPQNRVTPVKDVTGSCAENVRGSCCGPDVGVAWAAPWHDVDEPQAVASSQAADGILRTARSKSTWPGRTTKRVTQPAIGGGCPSVAVGVEKSQPATCPSPSLPKDSANSDGTRSCDTLSFGEEQAAADINSATTHRYV